MTQLYDLANQYFSLEEVKTLCYRLRLQYDDLPGDGKAAKIRELFSYLERHKRLGEFVKLARQERPYVSWPDSPEETPPPPPAPASPPQGNTFNISGDIKGRNINLGGTQHIEINKGNSDEN